MNPLLQRILRPYLLAPAGEGGSVTDRGDDFTPTGDDADPDKDKDTDPKAGEDDHDKDDDPDKVKAKDGEDDPDKDKPKDKDTRKDTRIPISRHKEILERERAAREDAERRLAQYEKGDKVAVINEEITKAEDKVLALDKEYAKLITDGEHEKAAEKMKEIRALERDISEKKGDMKAAAAYSQAVEQVRYDTVVERLEAAYPVLDPKHDDHDPEVTQDVLDLHATYRRKGMTPAAALQKAAEKLLGAKTKAQTDATTVTPRVDKDEAEAEARRIEKEQERKRTQVKKNLEASRQQPPDTSRTGLDADKAGGGTVTGKDIMKMKFDDFIKLDEETLANARGDNFVGS